MSFNYKLVYTEILPLSRNKFGIHGVLYSFMSYYIRKIGVELLNIAHTPIFSIETFSVDDYWFRFYHLIHSLFFFRLYRIVRYIATNIIVITKSETIINNKLILFNLKTSA